MGMPYYLYISSWKCLISSLGYQMSVVCHCDLIIWNWTGLISELSFILGIEPDDQLFIICTFKCQFGQTKMIPGLLGSSVITSTCTTYNWSRTFCGLFKRGVLGSEMESSLPLYFTFIEKTLVIFTQSDSQAWFFVWLGHMKWKEASEIQVKIMKWPIPSHNTVWVTEFSSDLHI